MLSILILPFIGNCPENDVLGSRNIIEAVKQET